jgi:hypothetical protein
MLGLQELHLQQTMLRGALPLDLGMLPYLAEVDIRNTLMTCCRTQAQADALARGGGGGGGAAGLLPPFLTFDMTRPPESPLMLPYLRPAFGALRTAFAAGAAAGKAAARGGGGGGAAGAGRRLRSEDEDWDGGWRPRLVAAQARLGAAARRRRALLAAAHTHGGGAVGAGRGAAPAAWVGFAPAAPAPPPPAGGLLSWRGWARRLAAAANTVDAPRDDTDDVTDDVTEAQAADPGANMQ